MFWIVVKYGKYVICVWKILLINLGYKEILKDIMELRRVLYNER